jgi:hypothetical protein
MRQLDGSEQTCPFCGSTDVDAEYVDIGVGVQQVTPFMYGACFAVQMNPYHDNSNATSEERARGWYGPPPVQEAVFDFDVYNGLKKSTSI